MRFYVLALVLPACLSSAYKLTTTTKRPRNVLTERAFVTPNVLAASTTDDDGDLSLTTVHDLIYLANVTAGGTEYVVQLDTGSSDLWIKGTTASLPDVNQTSMTYNLTYGIGWAYGNISYAAVEFAGFEISSQALLDVSSANNPALSYDAVGVLGLGFTSLSSIDYAVNKTGASTGRCLLYNMFNDNPSEPNYMTFSLQRSTESDDDVPGVFTIGEVETAYADVLTGTAIPTVPAVSPNRWTIAVDALLISGQNTTIPLSTTVSDVSSSKAVVLLDTGTSYTYVPEAIATAIYGNISGATMDTSLGQWVVPCDAEIDIALQIGGDVFPLHPLDVSPKSLTDSSTCVGSFIPQSASLAPGQFDWLAGLSVLRSVYSLYDFGDFDSSGNMGNPYVKLYSLIDPDEASTEFHAQRGGEASSGITYNAADSSSSSSSTTVSLSSDIVDKINKIGDYLPAVLALVALNALVVIILAIAAMVYMCRRRSKGARARRIPGRQTPLPNTNSTFGPSSTQHMYEPVSMALTDDTFVPPSPAFSKPGFEGDTLRAGDPSNRPKSVA